MMEFLFLLIWIILTASKFEIKDTEIRDRWVVELKAQEEANARAAAELAERRRIRAKEDLYRKRQAKVRRIQERVREAERARAKEQARKEAEERARVEEERAREEAERAARLADEACEARRLEETVVFELVEEAYPDLPTVSLREETVS
jgi:hypothetical protein